MPNIRYITIYYVPAVEIVKLLVRRYDLYFQLSPALKTNTHLECAKWKMISRLLLPWMLVLEAWRYNLHLVWKEDVVLLYNKTFLRNFFILERGTEMGCLNYSKKELIKIME